jgi:hypothetical protein
MSETTKPLIHKKMVEIMRDVEFIGKDQKNDSQGFKFRGIDDMYNYLHGIMAKHGVYSTSMIMGKDREERKSARGGILGFTTLHIKYTFIAEDGSSTSTEVIGEGMDSGDKSSNKAMAVGHKYALLQAFMIPTAEQKDPDAESPEVGQKLVNPDITAQLGLSASFGTKTFREEWKKLSKEDRESIPDEMVAIWKGVATSYDKEQKDAS